MCPKSAPRSQVLSKTIAFSLNCLYWSCDMFRFFVSLRIPTISDADGAYTTQRNVCPIDANIAEMSFVFPESCGPVRCVCRIEKILWIPLILFGIHQDRSRIERYQMNCCNMDIGQRPAKKSRETAKKKKLRTTILDVPQ